VNVTGPTRRRVRFGLRSLLVVIALFAVLFAYLGTYWRLAERGRAVQHKYGMTTFFYVAFEPNQLPDAFSHSVFTILFHPVNQLDRLILSGSPPHQGIVGLSDGKSPRRSTK
jgi:hypothetical protein